MVEKRKEKQKRKEEERKWMIFLEYYVTGPETLKHLALFNIFRHLSMLFFGKIPSNHPRRIFCWEQWVHDRCLYRFLATQHGYAKDDHRQHWNCPHGRAPFPGEAQQQSPINPIVL